MFCFFSSSLLNFCANNNIYQFSLNPEINLVGIIGSMLCHLEFHIAGLCLFPHVDTVKSQIPGSQFERYLFGLARW